jgi:sialidase-1
MKSLPRRTFFNLAGKAAAASVALGPLTALAQQTNEVGEASDVTQPLPVPEQAQATILETKVICRQPGKYLGNGTEYSVDAGYHPVIKTRVIEPDRYIGWPTIGKMKDGELIAIFSGDRDAHVCPWGKTQIIRSRDNGKTWSQPETINNTVLDDRDAGIIQTAQGTIVISWFTSIAFTLPVYKTAYERYARFAEKIIPEVREKYLGNWVRRSEDGGKTWGEAVRTKVSAPHGPISLKDGRLLYVGTSQYEQRKGIFIEESTDDGRSWKVIAELPKTDETWNMSEPHMVELASGKLIAMVRNEPKDRTKCFLLQSESTDGGKTWTPLHSTGIWGYPPHLIQLKNGWVMVVYGYRLEPYSQRACISKNEGKTWDIANPITIANAIGPDMGYPSSVQLDDESILTTFYQAPKAGDPTLLMSTHWKLK